jgi:hypothetical protein
VTEHKIRWYARIPVGSQEAPDGWLPRTAQMRGTWGWDVRCSCGMETRTGGATRRSIRELIWLHKYGIEGQGWWPIQSDERHTHFPSS